MAQQKTRYDLDKLKNLPILDVCEYLGLNVEKHGRNFWCKVRPEKEASVIVHPETNYFYDFGNGEHGSNIDLVQYAKGGISVGRAIRDLAKAFHIVPSESREESLAKLMNNWEYEKIGLQGDRAAKNLIFPIFTASTEDLLDMEYAYSMPMNQLRTEDMEAYRQILETKAIPFVENKRDCFYMSVWNHYNFLQMMGNSAVFFDSERTALKFESEIKCLHQSERALYKACIGTGIIVPEPQHYDPQRILSHMLQGKLTFSLGNANPDLVAAEARQRNCSTCERTVSYDAYCAAALDNHLHAATFCNGLVTLMYPETEKAAFDRAFPPIRKGKSPLLTVLLDAQNRTGGPSAKEPEKQLQSSR